MGTWDHFYQFWVGQQTLPGNILGDVLIGIATFVIGKYKVAPWLHRRHTEQLEQRERQHQELLDAHKQLITEHHTLIEQHQRQHADLVRRIDAVSATGPTDDRTPDQAAPTTPPATAPATAPAAPPATPPAAAPVTAPTAAGPATAAPRAEDIASLAD